MDIFSLLSYSELAFGRSINRGNYVWVTIGVLVFVFGMIFIIAFGVWASRRKYQVNTLKKLTTDLGLDFFKRGNRNETDWCVGKYQDFNLTMQGRTVSYRGELNVNRPGSSRKEVAYIIRLCISLPEIALDGIKVSRTIAYDLGHRDSPYLDHFDDIFQRREETDKLPETLKRAMVKFVTQNRGAFLLNNPHEVSPGHLPEGGFPTETTAVLVHDAYMRDIKTDSEKLKAVLDDLINLAGKIKTSMG